jgi:hypothetical protein
VVADIPMKEIGYKYIPEDNEGGLILNVPLPNWKVVLHFTVRCLKFLTTMTSVKIVDETEPRMWHLDQHLLAGIEDIKSRGRYFYMGEENYRSFKIRFTIPENITSENFHMFSAKDRKLRKETEA